MKEQGRLRRGCTGGLEVGFVAVLRHLIGEVLRTQRVARGLTLRDVSARAQVSLGYISEVERGQKEPSSELLAALCGALEVPLSQVLRDVSSILELEEGVRAPAGPTVISVDIGRARNTPQAFAA
ncbi:MAG: helix-turn-helix transcriptional regulator [Nocardioidaceae bacterium]|jgi:transcriptional regulator with XRE-family HTH domain|nr:helix-turn-helix transcriptional regulator [Nocardioidaceae bacterium]